MQALELSDFDKLYIAWIKDNLEKPGKTQSGLAEALGIGKSGISHALNGKARRFKLEEIKTIADYFDSEVPEWARVGSGPRLEVRGSLETGVYRKIFNEAIEFINCAPDDRYPSDQQFAFRMTGPGMDQLKPRAVLDGDLVLCVSRVGFGGSSALKLGDLVVLQHTLPGGVKERSLRSIGNRGDVRVFQSHSSALPDDDIPMDEEGPNCEILGVVTRILATL